MKKKLVILFMSLMISTLCMPSFEIGNGINVIYAKSNKSSSSKKKSSSSSKSKSSSKKKSTSGVKSSSSSKKTKKSTKKSSNVKPSYSINDNTTVYVSDYGKCYHRSPKCASPNGNSGSLPYSKVKGMGLSRCSKCW